MAGGSDVRGIMDVAESEEQSFITKDAIFNSEPNKKKKTKKAEIAFKKPDGMHRELWGLLCNDNRDAPPMIPTDTTLGYKQMKAKIGRSRVRPWKWMPFTNPARKDGAVFSHWRRVTEEGKDYPFARFNKTVDIPVYSDLEYQQHLHDDNWTRSETDALYELCQRFDLRFVIIHDRWDVEKHKKRSVEDIKERYYNICNSLTKVRAPPGSDQKVSVYDGDHERRRKDQLSKLFVRTQEQVEEEQHLIQELKKIELRKKEREKKTQDLQKLITAADSNVESRRVERKASKKKQQFQHLKVREGMMTPDTTGIKFVDFKTSGVSLRSQRMKLPSSVGQKKTKAIEQVLEELGIELNPMPTEGMVTHFNELRQDVVLLYELKLALANCEYELQTLRHRFETVAPRKLTEMNRTLTPAATPEVKIEDNSQGQTIQTDTIDVVGSPLTNIMASPATPNRKRRAALEQSQIMKKIKNKV